MSAEVAFTPKAAFSDPDSLGAVFVNDQTDVNVRELYTQSANGVFVVTDPAVIAALDNYPALKRAAVPQDAPSAEEIEASAAPGVPARSLDELSKRELLELPEAAEIDGAERMRVEELRDTIRSAREV